MTTWYTGPFERLGAARYTHLIRADDDPARAGAERPKGRGWNATDRRRRLSDETIAYHAQRLRQHLADGVARTFNRLAVELHDVTADVAFETHADAALWWLVAQRELEHTAAAPVVFRLCTPYTTPMGVEGLPVNPARPRWQTDPTNDRCDRCGAEPVPGCDVRLCPHAGCHWSVRIGEACGGFEQARCVLQRHLGECALARATPDRAWDDGAGAFVASPQLALFGDPIL